MPIASLPIAASPITAEALANIDGAAAIVSYTNLASAASTYDIAAATCWDVAA